MARIECRSGWYAGRWIRTVGLRQVGNGLGRKIVVAGVSPGEDFGMGIIEVNEGV